MPEVVTRRRDQICENVPTLTRVKSIVGNKTYVLAESCKNNDGRRQATRRTRWSNALNAIGGKVDLNFGGMLTHNRVNWAMHAHVLAFLLDAVVSCKKRDALQAIDIHLNNLFNTWNGGTLQNMPQEHRTRVKRQVLLL